MKKKLVLLIMCVLFILLCLGCSEKSVSSNISFKETKDEILEDSSKLVVSSELPVINNTSDDGINVDLIKTGNSISGSMSVILNNTQDYLGKTIKLRGVCTSVESSGRHYLELDDGRGMDEMFVEINSLSGRYPENNTLVEVVGTLVSYADGGFYIYRLDIE